MKERKMEFTLRNIVFYLSGFFFIGLAVNLLLRADLGAGAWDTVNYNFKAIFSTKYPWLTLGMCSLFFSTNVWAIVMLYRRKAKFLLMIIPLVLVSVSIDLWDIILLGDLEPSGFYEELEWAIFGGLLLPFALSLVIASDFPAFVFDELMIMLKDIFKTKGVVGVRIGIEIFAVVLAITFWRIALYVDIDHVQKLIDGGANANFGSVSYGTIILAFTIGPLIQYYLGILEMFNLDYLIEIKKSITKEAILRHSRNILLYIAGIIVISFGVVMMIKSEVGLSSWDTLHWSLHKLTGITVGDATIFVAMTFTAFVTIANKNLKYLLMTIPIFSVGALIDYFNLDLLVNYEPSNLLIASATYFTGLVLLPLGGSLLIISTYPAGVFDEAMLTIMRLLKTSKLMTVRVIMESIAVVVAIVLSLTAGDGLGMFKIGTIIFTLSIGFMLKTYLKLFEKIGLYETEEIS